MTMDSHSNEFCNTLDGVNFGDETFLPNFGQLENFPHTFQLDQLDLSFMDTPFLPLDPNPEIITSNTSGSSKADSPDDGDDVFKFINSILMEENIEEKPSMFPDPLAVQATERSLYNVIGEKYPSSPIEPPLNFNYNIDSPNDNLFGSSSEHSTFSNMSGGNNSVDSQWVIDPGTFNPTEQSNPFEASYNGLMDSSISNNMISSIFTDSESILQFQRGVEEASKFLPKSNQLLISLDSYALPPKANNNAPKVEVHVDYENKDKSRNGSGAKRSLNRTDTFERERSSKQSSVYEEEVELSDLFDRVLLSVNEKGEHVCCDEEVKTEPIDTPKENGSNGKNRAKKQGDKNEVVDLRTLLINCAQSVAADDRRTATEQLKNIRQYSSPLGDASQRVADIFANGLEARLAGTGSQKYRALASKKISATEKLKAYQLYLSCCPFKKLSMVFSNKLIYDLFMNSTKKKLHIIDFGIGYGFQWPIFLQYLSTLPCPPELRITGIELPQSGFRPAELVEETGRRLGKYCERFKIKFQYHPIAQKWETIKLEDLNLPRDEVIAVNCLFRFKNLLDETVVMDSPRDAVLKLIRNINPEIFISHTTNGSFSAPFFVTRFREALFYYSSHFDMFDTTIPSREDKQRINFEQEFYGREVMNIIACEGVERVERPETYKQWQVRNTRVGFKIQPLKEDLLKKLKGKMVGYHKDFVIDQDGSWLLQGWKGRILFASSYWLPA